ncbi:MAG: VTT domain-containing protein [bacterium]
MIHLLLTYKYIILIPLAIIEGPIVTILAGFLVTLGVMNPFIIYPIMVVGDAVGDGLIYYVGYTGKKLLSFFKVDDAKLVRAKKYFADNHHKAITMSKLIHGIGFVGLIAAGATHVPYKKYFTTCILISMVQSFVMLAIGILFGHAYITIEKYLNTYAAVVSSIGIIVVAVVVLKKYVFKPKIIL